MKYFIGVVISVVFVGIIAAFVSIGSPATQRERRFDTLRVNHLQMIQSELLRYWQSKGSLPAEVSQLKDDISGFRVPVDPETGSDYEYRTKSDDSFQLCATFSRGSESDSARTYPMVRKPMIPRVLYPAEPFGPYGEAFAHASGRVCFDRAIDKDLYPVAPKEKQLLPE